MNELTFQYLRRLNPESIAKYESLCEQEGVITDFYQDYLAVIQHLLKNDIHAVVDIGCASGVMAYMFQAASIRYVGIERCLENMVFGEFREKDGSIVVMHADWPCNIPEIVDINACVALYSIGTRSSRRSNANFHISV